VFILSFASVNNRDIRRIDCSAPFCTFVIFPLSDAFFFFYRRVSSQSCIRVCGTMFFQEVLLIQVLSGSR